MDGDKVVSVAYANDRVEAEMIQGLLESAGIPSVLQQLGVDGPMFGIGLLNPAGAPRRVMVRAEQSEEARAMLAETLIEDQGDRRLRTDLGLVARHHGPRFRGFPLDAGLT